MSQVEANNAPGTGNLPLGLAERSSNYSSEVRVGTSRSVSPKNDHAGVHTSPSSRHTPDHSPPAEGTIPIDPKLIDDQDLPTAVPQPHQLSLDTHQPLNPSGMQYSPADTRGGRMYPWPLRTDLLPESSEPTAISSSPATPGLGVDGLYHGQEWDLSRRSSVSEFDSYMGATQGMSTTASSESGRDDRQPSNRHAANDVPPPRPKKSHARKQPEGHIKRARNAFILFRKHITDSNLIPPSVEVKHQNISVVAAKMWREAPQEVRQKFQEQARIEKEEHQRKYPGYRYQPVFRRTDIIRRRVRKDPAEDEKVEAVAEALIKGKAGNELEQEIKDQMIARAEGSESDAEGSRSGARRRRREVGQLSKGAIRAQRAQARAKQMRQNLLGANLLNMSMYNAAQQRGSIPNHPGAQHHLQYAMAESYLPVSYDMEGQAVAYDPTGMYAAPGMDANDMYRLPPIDNMGLNYDPAGQWVAPDGSDYWQIPEQSGPEYDTIPPIGNEQYQLPPLIDPYGGQQDHPAPASHAPIDLPQADPRMHEWARDGQQTPSGHVMFNERLFDGALGSAGLPAMGVGSRNADLAGFDEAITQANELSHW